MQLSETSSSFSVQSAITINAPLTRVWSVLVDLEHYAAVVAETPEIARQAASLVVVRYQEQPHDVQLRADRGDFFTPEKLGGVYEADTESGDVEAAAITGSDDAPGVLSAVRHLSSWGGSP